MSKSTTWRVLKLTLGNLDEARYELGKHLENVSDETEKFILEDAIFQIDELTNSIKANLSVLK